MKRDVNCAVGRALQNRIDFHGQNRGRIAHHQEFQLDHKAPLVGELQGIADKPAVADFKVLYEVAATDLCYLTYASFAAILDDCVVLS